MINPKYNKQLVREMVEQIFTQDDETSKKLLEELNENRYKIRTTSLSAIFEFVEQGEELYNDNLKYKNFLRLLILACRAHNAKEHKAKMVEIVWKAVEHPSGIIRQTARQLLDEIRWMGYKRSLISDKGPEYKEETKFVLSLLETVEQKIKKHQLEELPTSVEKAKPSVYKTLNLIWHDLSRSEIVYEAIDDMLIRQIEKNILPYEEFLWDEDDDDFEDG